MGIFPLQKPFLIIKVDEDKMLTLMSVGGGLNDHTARGSIIVPAAKLKDLAFATTRFSLRTLKWAETLRSKKTIIDENVKFHAWVEMGDTHGIDRNRGFTVTDSRMVVVTKIKLELRQSASAHHSRKNEK